MKNNEIEYLFSDGKRTLDVILDVKVVPKEVRDRFYSIMPNYIRYNRFRLVEFFYEELIRKNNGTLECIVFVVRKKEYFGKSAYDELKANLSRYALEKGIDVI